MKYQLDKKSGGVTLGPCQVCDKLKATFYLCDKGHSMCNDCQKQKNDIMLELSERFESLKNRSPSSVDTQTSPSGTTISKTNSPRGTRIFCEVCKDFVSVILVTLPKDILTLVPRSSDLVEADEDPNEADDEYPEPTEPQSTVKQQGQGKGLKKELLGLRDQLGTAFVELLTTRENLDQVGQTTQKLGLDVDMLRGGVSYLYFNFDTLLKQKTIFTNETAWGIPFVVMVRLRKTSRYPHLGFFIGLDPDGGLAHSPLKKIIVLRAHNVYGKVIETLTMKTFEDEACVHDCFDLTKRQNGSLWGFDEFLRKDRIMRHDMLKDGRLCLSIQVKMLQ